LASGLASPLVAHSFLPSALQGRTGKGEVGSGKVG
jgi:hypothetical protein